MNLPGLLGRIILGIIIIPVAAVAGFAIAGLIKINSDEPSQFSSPRDAVIPHARGLNIPRLRGDAAARGLVHIDGGQPVAGATVRASAGFLQLEVFTDKDGRFSLEKLPEGPLTLVVQAAGYTPELYNSPDAPSREIDIRLSPISALNAGAASRPRETGAVDITIIAAAGERAANKLSLFAIPNTRDARETPLLPRGIDYDSEAAQSVAIVGVPAGEYAIIAVPAGQSPDRRRALAEIVKTVSPGKTESVTLTISTGRVAGRVVSGGKNVAGVRLRAVRRQDPRPADAAPDPRIVTIAEVEIARAISDSEGNFAMEMLPRGSIVLEASASGYASVAKNVSSDEAGTPFTLELTPAKQ